MTFIICIIISCTGDNNFPKNPDGSLIYGYVPPSETWTAMEKLVDEGLVKSIGVSNFNSSQVEEVSQPTLVRAISIIVGVVYIIASQKWSYTASC